MEHEMRLGSFFMLITKKINNNVAMAQDAQGNELVVFGKGVGFPPMPYELEDESSIQRVFHHVDSDLIATISSIAPEVIAAALDIVKLAAEELDCELNANLYLPLADHLQFSTDRLTQGVVMENPLAPEIPFVYPHEYEIGVKGLQIMREHTGVNLPQDEACAIALHIVNAESAGGSYSSNMQSVMQDVEVIDGIVALLEREMGTSFDRSSYNYRRFAAHLRYLIKRLKRGDEWREEDATLLDQISKDFPHAYQLARAVEAHLKKTKHWRLSNEEILYLMLYINRFHGEARDSADDPASS